MPTWTAKPASTATLDTGNALYANLLYALPMWEGSGNPMDVVNNAAWVRSGATGTPTWTTDPASSPALSFVAANEQVLVGSDNSLGSAWSICWRSIATSSGGMYAIYTSLGSAPSGADCIRICPAADSIYLKDANGTTVAFSYAGSNQAAWHDYALTYDGSSFRLYIDGSLNDTVGNTVGFGWGTSARIGGDYDGSQWYDGTIDYFYFLDTTITLTQAASIAGDPWQFFTSESAPSSGSSILMMDF